jgi:hypothetical protein
MTNSRDRLNKVVAIAISPGAYEEEAITALRKARELVAQEPSLAYPESPTTPEREKAAEVQYSHEIRFTNVALFWLLIMIDNLSKEAFGLGLKSKIEIDFAQNPYALDVRCDGSKTACDAFRAHADWLLAHVNSQPREP